MEKQRETDKFWKQFGPKKKEKKKNKMTAVCCQGCSCIEPPELTWVRKSDVL